MVNLLLPAWGMDDELEQRMKVLRTKVKVMRCTMGLDKYGREVHQWPGGSVHPGDGLVQCHTVVKCSNCQYVLTLLNELDALADTKSGKIPKPTGGAENPSTQSASVKPLGKK